MQTAVDAKHSLIVDYVLINDAADYNHLSPLAASAQNILEANNMTVVYYDTVELKACEDLTITAFVPLSKAPTSKEQKAPTPDYTRAKFVNDSSTDSYQCPQGSSLFNSGITLEKKGNRAVHVYRTDDCKCCQAITECSASPRSRHINRWEHEAVVDRLKEHLDRQPKIIVNHKEIIEHIFGTLKRIWGYGVLLRRMKNVTAEVALMTLHTISAEF